MRVGVAAIVSGVALLLVACVGDQNNTAVVNSDGGAGAGADGSTVNQTDGGVRTDGGTTGCVPCVMGKTKVGACCVQ
jgi:hypothetical protein